ncbi:MAG: phage tail tape measure protein, partial [Kiritimatiellae bacterium]|nr:phage tail tape measure protein [Kiritimatiellia bacterium]
MPNTNAIRAGRAFVELFADDSKLVRGLRRAEAKLKAFGNSVRDIGMGMAKLGAAAAAPLIASTKVFTGFDDQMRAVQATLGATGDQFDRLNEKAKHLGETTSYTAAQVAGAMLNLARAGFNTDEIDAAISGMLSLARATGTDLAMATEIAGNTLRSFGLAAEDMGHVADVMTATANNSAQTLEDLGWAMKYAAPIADAYGLSIEQTSKALGALANFGIKGSMAGNTMKNIMLQLSNPSIRKKIEGLGVAVTDSAGKFRDVG